MDYPDNKDSFSRQKQLLDDSQLYQLIEQIPIPIYIVDQDYFLFYNAALKKITGYDDEELLNTPWWSIVVPEMQALMRQRAIDRNNDLPVPENYELALINRSGEIVYAHLFNITISHKGQKLILAGAYDITARKEAEAQLLDIHNQLEERVASRTVQLQEANAELTRLNNNLNSIFMNMSDAVMVVNERGEIDVLNRALSAYPGELQDVVRQKIMTDVINSSNIHLNSMLKARKAFRDVELTIPAKSGDIRFLASGTPLSNESESVNSGIVILRHMTEIHRLVNRLSGSQAIFEFSDILSRSDTMFEAIRIARLAASNLSTVLIQGESGTGKELFAQAIHNQSERRQGPFVALNCGALPRELVGSELFGYSEGAFTGAKKGGNPGKFELASGGTLFLDEIGDMPFEQQVALLRVLQERRVMRIGSEREIAVDVRIICATNKDLMEEVRKGSFRSDLYYRISVIPINIPPLRERPEDIGLLFDSFLNRANSARPIKERLKVEPDVYPALEKYPWPGNVRELQNVVERVMNVNESGSLTPGQLPPEICFSSTAQTSPGRQPADSATETSGRQRLRLLSENLEKQEILRLIAACHGNVTEVARSMGISRNTLYNKLKKYGITIRRTIH